MTTANAITLIRKAVFSPSVGTATSETTAPPTLGRGSSSSKQLTLERDLWVNVTMPGPDDVVIDGAYWLNPKQQPQASVSHPQQAHAAPHFVGKSPAQQAWVVWLLGNGEVYEFALDAYIQFAKDVGANMFMFNYRGVALSQGTLWQASDLIADTKVVYDYLIDSLGAKDENILFMGHSIGGAAASCFRGTISFHCDITVATLT